MMLRNAARFAYKWWSVDMEASILLETYMNEFLTQPPRFKNGARLSIFIANGVITFC